MPDDDRSAIGDLSPEDKIDARERALELLYEAEIKGDSPDVIVEALPVVPELMTLHLVRGVAAHRDEIDEHLTRVSKGWDLHRMPVIDRTVLRMGTFELGWDDAVPVAVILNEAVELAKRFSTEQSSKFVNGVLARLASELRA